MSREKINVCPKCGSMLHEEVYENISSLYLSCIKPGCGYEHEIKYHNMKFKFVYREEFVTEIVAKSLEEAIKKLDHVTWRRTDWYLWDDYFDVTYYPDYKLNQRTAQPCNSDD